MSSDSDYDIFTRDLKNTNVSAKDPNLSTHRNKNMKRSMGIPWNFTQNSRSGCDHTSMNSRRDTSHRSIYAFTNFVSAIDVASSLEFNLFNKKDVKMIRNSYKKFEKNNQHLFSNSEDDFSLSIDDDDSSLRLSIFNENISNHRSSKAHSNRFRKSRQKSARKCNSVNFTQKTYLPNKNDNLLNPSQIGGNIFTFQKINKSIAAQPTIENISNTQSAVELDGDLKIGNSKDDSTKPKFEDELIVIANEKSPKLSPIKKFAKKNLKRNWNTRAVNICERRRFFTAKASTPFKKISRSKTKTLDDNFAQTSVLSTSQNMKAVGGNKEDVKNEQDVAFVIFGCNEAGGSDDIFVQNSTDTTKENNLKTDDRTKKSTQDCQVIEKENLPVNTKKLTTDKQKISEIKDNSKEKEELRSVQMTKNTDTNNCSATHSKTTTAPNITRLNNLKLRSHRMSKTIVCSARSQVSSNKGAGTDVELNSQQKDKNLIKNITNNRQKEDTEDIVVNRSSRTRSIAQIGKNNKSDDKTGKLTKTRIPIKTKVLESNESDTSHSIQQSSSNNKTETEKG